MLIDWSPHNFTDEEAQDVINKTKSFKFIDPGSINKLMLRTGVKYLTKVLNMSLTTFPIPDVWKVGRVVPRLKPGKPWKPVNQGSLIVQ